MAELIKTTLMLTGAVLSGLLIMSLGPASLRQAFQRVDFGSKRGFGAACLALLVVLILHEAGHLIAAIVLRFRVLAFTLGPLRLEWLYGQWCVRVVPGNWFSASVWAIPNDDHCMRERLMAVVAAGPAATLLSAAGSLFWLQRLQQGSWLEPVLSACVSLSCLIFLLSLIPNGGSARRRNDAQLLRALWSNKEEAQEIELYYQLTRLRVLGIRPRDYPDELLTILAYHQGRPDICIAFAVALLRSAMDRCDWTAVEQWRGRIQKLTIDAGPAASDLARGEAACFLLLSGSNKEGTEEAFSSVHFSNIQPRWVKHRLLAAAKMAAGRRQEAEKEIALAMRRLRMGVPESSFERDLLLRIAACGVMQKAATS